MRIGGIHDRSNGPGMWCALALSAAGLALVAAGAESNIAGHQEQARDSAATCATVPQAARADGRGREDGHAITPKRAAEFERQLRAAALQQQAPEPASPQTIPVAVHVISSEDGTGELTRDTVESQLDVLNTAYSGDYAGADTGFRFELTDVTHSANDSWFADFGAHEETVKRELRQGGAGTLNVYTADMGEGVLGQSTYPQEYSEDPDYDGVAIDYRSVPGGERERFDRGMTAVHETGHWLGLFHTFQNGCSSPGDYVADTPYEREQATGCPTGRDTCPKRAGKDPVTNFMNYSDDSCLDRFTPGQAKRMAEHWTAFRA